MKEAFYINRQGKRYVLYAGLLDEFHSRFNNYAKSIETELIQIPSPDNGNVAVARAVIEVGRIEMMPSEDGKTIYAHPKEKYTGIGDASPDNVGRNIVPHIIRMAETRAKARALRDAVNVGVAALEELSDHDREEATAPTERRPPQGQRQGPEPLTEGAPMIDDRQIRAIDEVLGKLSGKDEDKTREYRVWIEREMGSPIEMLTVRQAESVLMFLNKRHSNQTHGRMSEKDKEEEMDLRKEMLQRASPTTSA